MAIHKVKGFVTYEHSLWDKHPVVSFKTYDPRQFGSFEGAVVREQEIELEIPDDFDPRPDMVATLQAQKTKARAELAARIKDLDEQIARLQAIEYVAA